MKKEQNNKIFQAVLSGYTGRKADKMKTKPIVMSIRQIWDEIVEPSIKMDETFRAHGIDRHFDYLAVFIDKSEKIYRSYEEIMTDTNRDVMYNVNFGHHSTSLDGSYSFILDLTTIK